MNGDSQEDQDTKRNIQIWKIKKLMHHLDNSKGNGTSMVSMIIPPKDQLSRVQKMLLDEQGAAVNIKSRVNKQSVLAAITSASQRLKLYSKVPPNGLILFTGTIINEEGKEKKITIDFEPFKPINTSMYQCDNRFHTEALHELLENDSKFGFIIMDGHGTLFGSVSGSAREILHKFDVDLPKKHGRGGQSAMRFARLRMEKRHNYIRKVAELATQLFINVDRPNVSGLVLAGSADFKTELSQSDLFDPRLQPIIVNIVDISYGGENGFNQAIELSADALANVKFVQEKKLIQKYFELINLDSGKFCFGVDDTMKCLMDMRAVEHLIVYENLEITRYVCRHPQTEEEKVCYVRPDQEKDMSFLKDQVTGVEYEVVDKMSLVEWLTEHYQEFGAKMDLVTDKSQEGSQFVRGFGGIGAILRYRVNLEQIAMYEDEDMWEDD
ncbi:hypothetical protein MIR68_010178 [Amoeboaphelidium protococcarum]|nr:hypothetical protein MIR68_010178 [Amoeboaphelidium protococcarum]KAI3650807.1 hypothetical protein MP228_004288 [Amoeboaphelidium protococcarum]KAI3652275.1 hypothetical protein MP228_003578 [Amoeboaphelidium protococcarum]